jgi:phage terminase large subunit-like protein
VSAQCEAGNVKIVRGLWNDEFIRELENFPQARHDDCVNAFSGAHEQLRESNSSGNYSLGGNEAARTDADVNC